MTEGHPVYIKEAEDLVGLHLLKSGGYGTSEDLFANFSAVKARNSKDRWEYAQDRIVEKSTRIKSLTDQGLYDLLPREFRDQAGLALCCLAMLHDDVPGIDFSKET